MTGFEPDLCGIPDVMEDHQVKVVPVGLIDHVRAETIQIALSLFLSVQISLICVCVCECHLTEPTTYEDLFTAMYVSSNH